MSSRKTKSIQRKLYFDAQDVTPSPSKQEQQSLEGQTKTSKVVTQSGQKRAANGPVRASARLTATKQSQSIESFLSPKKKRATEVVSSTIVTPADGDFSPKFSKTDNDKEVYVPSYIHKNVEYISMAKMSNLSPVQTRVLEWISEQYELPKDLEQNRKYGPLSGSSYADRVISAYRLGSLKRANDGISEICTACANLGHDRDNCSTLL